MPPWPGNISACSPRGRTPCNQHATAPGHALPAAYGYTVSGLAACGVWAAMAGAAVLLPRVLSGLSAGRGRAGQEGTWARVERNGERELVEEMEMESVADVLPYEEHQHEEHQPRKAG